MGSRKPVSLLTQRPPIRAIRAGDRWSVKLWARNLTDEEFPVRGFFFGNDPRDGYTAHGFTQLGAPQHAGVTVNIEW